MQHHLLFTDILTHTYAHTPHFVDGSGHTHTKMHGPVREQQHTDMLRTTKATAHHNRKANNTRPGNVQSEGHQPRPLHSEWVESVQNGPELDWMVGPAVLPSG